jgi:hypothetical protein
MTENTTAIAHVAKVLDDGGDHTERVDFLNGYGVSIIRNAFSYGGRDGKFEVAVIDADGNLQYDTPVTGDVLGYLDIPEVVAAMQAVATGWHGSARSWPMQSLKSSLSCKSCSATTGT